MTTKQIRKRTPVGVGQIFGRFEVKGEAPARISSSNNNTSRMVNVKCMCGEERIVALSSLRSGNTKSCGCYRRDNTRENHTKHGGRKDRLYKCWLSMTQRSKRRGCEVFPAWATYEGFKGWALSSGYEEHLVLCRNGDVGDYTPSNTRWDTKGNNTIEALARCYEVSYPDGRTEVIRNLSEFCRNHDLRQPEACKVSLGQRRHHRGYSFRRINGNNTNTLSNTLSEACGEE